MRRLRRILLWTVAILCLPLVLVAGAAAAFLWLAGEDTWTAALRTATDMASSPRQQISVEGFRRDGEGVLRLRRFGLADAEGDWLVAEDIAVDLHPSHLFDRTVHLQSVTVGTVELLRQPPSDENPAPPEPFSFPGQINVPELPVALALKQLSVGEIVLAEGVAPERTSLSASGSAEALPDRLELDLAIVPLDLGDSRLTASVSVDPGTGRIAADIDASLPAIEPLRSALAAPDGSRLNLNVSGGGPLSDARLDFGLSVDGVLDVIGDVRLAMSPESGARIELNAFSSLLGGVTSEPATLLGPSVGLALSASLPQPDQVTIESMTVDAQYLRAQTSGNIDLDSSKLALETTATLHHHPGLDGLLQGAAFTAADLSASVQGSLDAPAVVANLTLDGPAFDGFAASSIRLSLNATAIATYETAAGKLSIIAIEPVAADPQLAPLLGKQVAVRTDFTTSSKDVRLSGLQLDTALATLAGDLSLDPARSLVSGEIVVKSEQLSAVPQLSELMTAGSAHLSLLLDKAGAESGDVTLDARLDGLQMRDPALQSLTGKTVTLSGKVAQSGTDRSADMAIRAAGGLEGRVAASLAGETIEGTYRVALPSVPAGLVPSEVTGLGNIVLDGSMSGPLDNPAIRARLTSNNLAVNGVPVESPAVSISARNLTNIPDSQVRAEATVMGKAARFASAFTIDPATGQLTIGDLKLDWKSVQVTAAGTADINTLTTGIEATVQADLSELSDLAGQDLAGTLDASLSTRRNGTRTDALIDARIIGLEAPGTAVEDLTLAIVLQDALAETPGLSGDLTITGLVSGDATISTVNARFSGDVGRPAAEIRVEANQPAEAVLTTEIRADLTNPEAIRATVAALRLVAKQGEVTAASPFVVTARGETIELSGLNLTSSVGGRVAGNATYAPDRIAASIDMDELGVGPIAAIAGMEGFAGNASATVRLDTALPGDRATLAFRVSGLTVPDVPTDTPFAINLNAAWDGRQATADAEIAGPFERPLVARLTADLPAVAGQPFPEPPQDGRLQGAVNWQGDISRLLALLPESDHLADGAAKVDVRIGGTWSDPAMTGSASIANARYENLLSGTQLNSIGLDVSFNDAGAGKFSLSALGPEGGTVKGDGEIVLIGPDKGADIRIAMRRLVAMRRDEVRAVVGGDTRLTWDGERVKVHVRKVLERVDVFLAAPDLPPSVVAIDLERDRDRVEEKQEDTGPGLPVDLDIQVSSPGQFFVRGRGLESEWRGDLIVTGTAGDPVIRSRFEAVRGSLALLGRDFRLDKGELGLDESFKPAFRIELVRETPDVTGRIIVSGSPAKPDIAFSSEPELPPDEVLPRILFDKAKQSLSPLEAVNLAQGIRTLTNGKPGTTDRIREAVGLDVLRFEEGDSEDSAGAVSVGRYVREGVYVGAKKSVDSDAGSVVVEIDILPNVKVDAEVGQSGGGSTGITWEKKY